ncbi:hypothetical protein Q8A64_01115 [Oxalobacteraceae bacterium R-40]|uniref:Competence protein CoiA-like protein n=1 Tax=Keguizhuia sedimenti TaxID=3064264 RepID=A0ABU1BJ16_9BURK|nr:hypothetical protein [Oxalobacteraceae bacterium R-40]
MGKTNHEPLISYARAANGDVASIHDVPSGLACACTCLACQEPVIARKGAVRRWSFAHGADRPMPCEWAAETALHYAMKQLIAEERRILIPQLAISVQQKTSYGETLSKSKTFPEQEIALDTVYLEYSVHPIRPDVVAVSNGRKLLIEIVVTHDVDETKRTHIKKIGASAIRINLKRFERTVDRDALHRLLLESCPEKEWIYHSRREELAQRLHAELEVEVAEKERAHAQRIAERFEQKEKVRLKVAAPIQHEPDIPFSDGSVMCFRLKDEGEAYIKRAPSGALTLEFSNAASIDMSALINLNARRTMEPRLWNLSEASLVSVIPYLNNISSSTTNRTKKEYMAARYSLTSIESKTGA